MNGGGCTDAVNKYTCDCPSGGSGFYGANCECKFSMLFQLFVTQNLLNLDSNQMSGLSTGSSGRVGGGKKHEIYVTAKGGHLFL